MGDSNVLQLLWAREGADRSPHGQICPWKITIEHHRASDCRRSRRLQPLTSRPNTLGPVVPRGQDHPWPGVIISDELKGLVQACSPSGKRERRASQLPCWQGPFFRNQGRGSSSELLMGSNSYCWYCAERRCLHTYPFMQRAIVRLSWRTMYERVPKLTGRYKKVTTPLPDVSRKEDGAVTMDRTNYPSDVTDEQWQIIRKLLPPKKPRGRRPIDRREILNAIFYVNRTGCPCWR
jgi:hypothetical protein